MAIQSDDLTKMALAAQMGLPIDLTGFPIDKEHTDAYLELLQEFEQAPKDTMAYLPNEWANPDAYKSIIEATEKAYGGVKIYDQQGIVPEDGKPPVAI